MGFLQGSQGQNTPTGAAPAGIVANPGETPQQTAARYAANYHSPDAASVNAAAQKWANPNAAPNGGPGVSAPSTAAQQAAGQQWNPGMPGTPNAPQQGGGFRNAISQMLANRQQQQQNQASYPGAPVANTTPAANTAGSNPTNSNS